MDQLRRVECSSGLPAIASDGAKACGGEMLTKRSPLYVRVPMARDESKTAPPVPRPTAVMPFSASPRLRSNVPW